MVDCCVCDCVGEAVCGDCVGAVEGGGLFAEGAGCWVVVCVVVVAPCVAFIEVCVASEAARVLRISDEESRSLVEPVKLCEFRHPAERPRYTPLRCLVSERIGLAALRNWRASLAEYIREVDAS